MSPITASEQIEIAKAYVALSNAHRLELILPLFTENASYHSAYVGDIQGKSAIEKMMADYFARFPDVHWNVTGYRCTGSGIVSFEFALTATDAQTAERTERMGFEQIEFTDQGQIHHLDVKPL